MRRRSITRVFIVALLAALTVAVAAVAANAAPSNGLVPIGGSPGYTYADPVSTEAATVAIDAPQTGASLAGHFAVWVGSQDKVGDWIQVGVMVQDANAPCVYVETMVQHVHSVYCVYAVAYGQRVVLRMTDSPKYGWVAWANGAPVATAKLGAGLDWYAVSESYLQESAPFTLIPG